MVGETTIRAIETQYRGYRFRSRLEARWACFFDALGVAWQYEPQGFDLGGCWYLPDFWVRFTESEQRPYPEGTPPECGYWVEIKPTKPDDATLERCHRLSVGTGHVVYLLAGNVGPTEFVGYKWHPEHSGICEGTDRSASNFLHYIQWFGVADRGRYFNPSFLLAAFGAARSARFEHGEAGR